VIISSILSGKWWDYLKISHDHFPSPSNSLQPSVNHLTSTFWDEYLNNFKISLKIISQRTELYINPAVKISNATVKIILTILHSECRWTACKHRRGR
jgi:hypothetical protein